MYKIGDAVLYGTQGVCKIEEVTEMDFSGKPMKYFVLNPIFQKGSKIFVPVDNEKLVGKMKRALTKSEIMKIITSLPQEDEFWIQNENERKSEYQKAISTGDRKSIIGIIKALHSAQKRQEEKGKKLHMSDDKMLKDAERIIYDEFALGLDIKPDEVLPFITKTVEA